MGKSGPKEQRGGGWIVVDLDTVVAAFVGHINEQEDMRVTKFRYWIDAAKGQAVIQIETDDAPRHRGRGIRLDRGDIGES